MMQGCFSLFPHSWLFVDRESDVLRMVADLDRVYVTNSVGRRSGVLGCYQVYGPFCFAFVC